MFGLCTCTVTYPTGRKIKTRHHPEFDKPPTIDGKLDEEVWQKAAVLKDFYQIQPGDNTPPSKPTEVLIGFDPKFSVRTSAFSSAPIPTSTTALFVTTLILIRRSKCTFYGESNERSSNKQHLSFYAGSSYSKKIQFNGQVTQRWGHFDLDFGNGSKYPPVNPQITQIDY